jgi:hypothetical protein
MNDEEYEPLLEQSFNMEDVDDRLQFVLALDVELAVRRFESRFVEVVNEELYGPFCDDEAEPHLISKHGVSCWHADFVDERIECAVKRIREAIYDVFGEVDA